MPTYVYSCDQCQQQFEVEQRMSEDALTTCRCGQEGSVRRVPQRTGVIFNGPGFYVTDSGCTGEPASCNRCSNQES